MDAALDVHRPGLAELGESEEFTDCKVICGLYHFNLHKVILASQSVYFKSAFKTGTFKEGESGTIELKCIQSDTEQYGDDNDDACDDPEIVKLMIEYFYHFDYGSLDTQWGCSTPSEDHLIDHAKVFATAVKYQADGLRKLAVASFKASADTEWDRENFPHAIHIVYNSTADDVLELREIVTNVVHKQFGELNTKETVKAVVSSIPSLAYGLLERGRTKFRCGKGHCNETCFRTCPHCNGSFDGCKVCCNNKKQFTCPYCDQYFFRSS